MTYVCMFISEINNIRRNTQADYRASNYQLLFLLKIQQRTLQVCYINIVPIGENNLSNYVSKM